MDLEPQSVDMDVALTASREAAAVAATRPYARPIGNRLPSITMLCLEISNGLRMVIDDIEAFRAYDNEELQTPNTRFDRSLEVLRDCKSWSDHGYLRLNGFSEAAYYELDLPYQAHPESLSAPIFE